MHTKQETLRHAPLTRELDVGDFQIERQEGKSTRLMFSASSEYPVERWFGKEVLEHSAGAIRLDRVKRGAVPLLFNHDMDDVIGMVDDMRIVDKRLMCEAHFFDTDRAREVERMLDGGLRNVSIRYRIHTVQVDMSGDERIIDWEPLEQSIVSIPADPTVGLGRAEEGQQAFEAMRIFAAPDSTAVSAANQSNKRKEHVMDDDEMKADDKTVAADPKNGRENERGAQVRDNDPDRRSNEAVGLERKRRQGIENLCKANKIDEKIRDYWISAGLSLNEVAEDLLKIIEERGERNPQPLGHLGLTEKETKRFSIMRAIQAVAEKDWTHAGFELECSRAVANKMNKSPDPNKFYVPFEVMQDQRITPEARRQMAQRDLTVGTAGAGGYLVETANMGFIELLRNRSVVFRMGVRRLSGLVGNVAVPRQSAAATAYWLATEATQITESQQTFVQMALTPKTVGAYTEISRQLLLQSSPDAEGIVVADLAAVTALAADLAVLNGSGSAGQPEGILQTSGIGSVSGSSIAFAGILEFQTDVAASNVMPMRGGYVTTPAVAALLMARVKFSSTASPLWEGNIWDGSMVGFPAMSSNQIPAATAIFGDWQEAVVGEWGVLEVEVNPYANFQAGIIGVRAMYTMDVGIRRPFAFSAASSIT